VIQKTKNGRALTFCKRNNVCPSQSFVPSCLVQQLPSLSSFLSFVQKTPKYRKLTIFECFKVNLGVPGVRGGTVMSLADF